MSNLVDVHAVHAAATVLSEPPPPVLTEPPPPGWLYTSAIVMLLLAVATRLWFARPIPAGSFRVHAVRYRGRLENHGYADCYGFPSRMERQHHPAWALFAGRYSIFPDLETARVAAREFGTLSRQEHDAGISEQSVVIEVREGRQWILVEE